MDFSDETDKISYQSSVISEQLSISSYTVY